MTRDLSESLRFLNTVGEAAGADASLLTFRRGIEREALRVTPEGTLARTPHPAFLGSKLTHPKITTDFSESQLELITPVHESPEASLADLEQIHRYIYSGLEDEILWSASMPCVLQDDAAIPLAYYGDSNIGRLKTTYRHGLGVRYGRGMQTICAVHYNFSFPDKLFSWLQAFEQDTDDPRSYRTRRYFDMMRNFRRYSWLLTYLFGASPAVCNSFVRGREHDLQAFDHGTAYMPYATSLRSGGLGYQSDVQATRMKVCYNSLQNYVQSLADAITTPYEGYTQLGVTGDGKHLQVSDCILQSEAEFYSSIRAKCVPPSGKNFLAHLMDEGVQYIEVRLLDVNPYLPLGIDATTIRFIDSFLLYCLISDSPLHDDTLCSEVSANSLTTVYLGRSPDASLTDQGKPRTLRTWGASLLDEIEPFARLLDATHEGSEHRDSLAMARERLTYPDRTPSGQILNDMRREKIPFFRFAMNRALANRDLLTDTGIPAEEQARWQAMADESREKHAAIERTEQVDFDTYLQSVHEAYVPLRSDA